MIMVELIGNNNITDEIKGNYIKKTLTMPSSAKVLFWIYFDRKMLELTSLLSWVIIHGNMTCS